MPASQSTAARPSPIHFRRNPRAGGCPPPLLPFPRKSSPLPSPRRCSCCSGPRVPPLFSRPLLPSFPREPVARRARVPPQRPRLRPPRAALNLLLPRGEEVAFSRAWSVSGATTFLLQVMPFRTGEVGTWASLRSVLGATWARSAAVFALVKLLDTATLLLAGVAGAAWLLLDRGTPALGGRGRVGVRRGRGASPRPARRVGPLVARLLPRSPGKAAARGPSEPRSSKASPSRGARPARYLGAALAAFAFLALHLAALLATAKGLGLPLHPATLAVALLASVTTAAVLPSPAGTFGPYESGFAARPPRWTACPSRRARSSAASSTCSRRSWRGRWACLSSSGG